MQKKLLVEDGCLLQSVILMQRNLVVKTGCSLQLNWLSAEPGVISRFFLFFFFENFFVSGERWIERNFSKEKYVSPWVRGPHDLF